MRPLTKPFAVPFAALEPLAQAAARSAGRPLDDLLGELGLSAGPLSGEVSRSIGLADLFRVLGTLARTAGNETLPASNRPLMPGSTDFVLSHVPGAENLVEAMRRIANARNMLHGGAFNHVETDATCIRFVVDDSGFPYTLDDQQYRWVAVECVLILFHCTMMLLSSPELDAKLIRLHLKRATRPTPGSHLDFWQTPIRWKSPAYVLVYDLSAAELPVPQRGEAVPPMNVIYRRAADIIHRRAQQHIALRTLAESVQEALESGQPTMADVASQLGMSVATLRRRLADEGTTFRELRHRVLNDIARARLDRGEHVAEVAEALEFSDFRSFSRAFKLWNGMTPASYVASRRRTVRGGGSTQYL